MIEKLHIAPYEKEQPSEYADRLGITYAKQVSLKHKKDNGQYFTPTPIAKLMASFCEHSKSLVERSVYVWKLRRTRLLKEDSLYSEL